ncbi:GDP-fucose synthetase [Helicobacter sp. 16-1353]|uniref:GDP-L-fucose synthase family protein n=1 Tax=Helicobacter sp. 16-1353 TaxID=2004996 RepID=UPI000DCD8B49|nr:GDP-L-fucose synthase [Helicobacter sp. 16-1353]RAX54231.1 GDP-fucose synthetase [Helicobacter sp. 16-1353]
MNLDSRIFVAGHRGLVGSAILQTLKYKGYKNIITKTKDELDLRDFDKVSAFFENNNIDIVILAAAKVGGIMANNIYRADFIYENIAIQNNVIFNAYKYHIKKLLFLGSSCIYPKYAKQPMSEDCLLSGELEYTNEPYAIAKIAGLKMCESYAIQYGCNFISVMPTNLYGNNDNFDLQDSHVLPALIRKMYLAKCLENNDIQAIKADLGENYKEILDRFNITKNSVEVWGSGNVRREFLHSLDMAKACIFIMENVDFKDLATSKNNEIRNTHINIGYGSDITIRDLAFLIKNIVGFSGKIVFNTNKPDGTPQKLLDISKLKKLGYSPSITLEDGIKEVYKNYKNR